MEKQNLTKQSPAEPFRPNIFLKMKSRYRNDRGSRRKWCYKLLALKKAGASVFLRENATMHELLAKEDSKAHWVPQGLVSSLVTSLT